MCDPHTQKTAATESVICFIILGQTVSQWTILFRGFKNTEKAHNWSIYWSVFVGGGFLSHTHNSDPIAFSKT